MFLCCQCRCYSPGPILVALEKRTPCIWWRRASHCEQNEMWSEKQPSLVSVFPICSHVKHLQHTVSPAGKASRWHCSALHTELVCKQPWQEHIWRDMGEAAVNPFPCWGSLCSTSTSELLQHCSGVQNSASASIAAQDVAVSHLCRCISLSDVRRGQGEYLLNLGLKFSAQLQC